MKVDRHGYMNLTGQLVAIAGEKEHKERKKEEGSGDGCGNGVDMKVVEP